MATDVGSDGDPADYIPEIFRKHPWAYTVYEDAFKRKRIGGDTYSLFPAAYFPHFDRKA